MTSTQLHAFSQLSAAVGESLWPATVSIGGTDYACAVVRPRQGHQLGPFSDDPEAVTLTVRIRKTLLATAPPETTPLLWEGSRWKVRSILGQEASEAVWTLACHPAP